MKQQILISLKALAFFALLLGIIYPLCMTGFAQTFFNKQANGSLIEYNGQIVGSSLLAQKTNSDKYFWPRPSASDYGTLPSGASNLGPVSKVLKKSIDDRKSQGMTAEMLFASGSGLDPHISLDAALSQVPRVVKARQLSEADSKSMLEFIRKSLEPRDFGIFGEPRINVLHLNIEMDR